MNRDLAFDNLALALRLAAPHVADAPACDCEPDLVEDLRGLVDALGFVLRRYRDAITTVPDDPPP